VLSGSYTFLVQTLEQKFLPLIWAEIKIKVENFLEKLLFSLSNRKSYRAH
jgi:hypothetical protein